MVILAGMRWYLSVVLIYVSVIVGIVEYLRVPVVHLYVFFGEMSI